MRQGRRRCDGRANGQERLFAYSEPLDKTLVSLKIIVFEIIQEPPPLADYLQEAAPGMVILNVSLEVPGEVFDPLAEERYLYFGRAGVRFVKPELVNDLLTLWLSNSHKSPLYYSLSFF